MNYIYRQPAAVQYQDPWCCVCRNYTNQQTYTYKHPSHVGSVRVCEGCLQNASTQREFKRFIQIILNKLDNSYVRDEISTKEWKETRNILDKYPWKVMITVVHLEFSKGDDIIIVLGKENEQ